MGNGFSFWLWALPVKEKEPRAQVASKQVLISVMEGFGNLMKAFSPFPQKRTYTYHFIPFSDTILKVYKLLEAHFSQGPTFRISASEEQTHNYTQFLPHHSDCSLHVFPYAVHTM